MQFQSGWATAFTAADGTDVITAAGHVLTDGDTVELSLSGAEGDVLPTGLAADTTYYARDVSGDTLKLAATSGGAAIDITGVGTGTHYLGVIPRPMRSAMLLLIGHWWKNREAVGNVGAAVPLAVDSLLWPYRVLQF